MNQTHSSAPEPSQPARYKFQILSWVTAFIIGFSLLIINLDGAINAFEFHQEERFAVAFVPETLSSLLTGTWSHGWPISFLRREYRNNPFVWFEATSISESSRYSVLPTSRWPFDDAKILRFSLAYLVLDVAVAIGIMFCSVVAVEQWCRKRFIPTQYTVSSLLAIMGTVATFVWLAGAADYPLDNAIVQLCTGLVFIGIGLCWYVAVEGFWRVFRA